MDPQAKIREGRFAIPDLSTLPADGRPEFNRLVFTASPYLLQHARNPVDWFPWGPEAFDKARREDKPVFLSIGYSTCHWCHVMAEESFEDRDVAAFLNERWVSVKVDREERPDLDHIYMQVCQALTGGGGWPLSVFLTPEGKPFFAGTYFPREARFGHPGFLDLLQKLFLVWNTDRPAIEDGTGQIMASLATEPPADGDDLPAEILTLATGQYLDQYDERYGGFGAAPKFPMGHQLCYLLRQYDRSREPRLLAAVEHTLTAMHQGGIYDQIGFGFCRYSTDRQWRIPHFEKMLYDNALLLMAYTEAGQVTGKPLYAQVVDEIAAYVQRELGAPEGGFACAENADSEGEEGRFYLFTRQEILETLGEQEGNTVADHWGVTAAGNFENGRNILHVAPATGLLARMAGGDQATAAKTLLAARGKLFAWRSRRVHPSLDDKILASWNGLMIAALAKAGRAFGRDDLTGRACAGADFLLREMVTPEGVLRHSWRAGTLGTGSFLEDYAFLAWGLIDLYQATFRVRYLEWAISLTEKMLADFAHPAGGFYQTPSDGETLLVRPVEILDGALPSGASVAALNLVRLARLTGRPEWEKAAQGVFRAAAGPVRRMPTAFPSLLTAFDAAVGPAIEIVLTGPDAASLAPLTRVVGDSFLPRVEVLARLPGPQGEALERLAPFVREIPAPGSRPTAHVCRDFSCQAPVTTPEALRRVLGLDG